MEEKLAIAQSLKYAEELGQLYEAERAQRRITEDALARLEASYRTTVRALAAALELRDDQTGAHAERVTELALRLAGRVLRVVSSAEQTFDVRPSTAERGACDLEPAGAHGAPARCRWSDERRDRPLPTRWLEPLIPRNDAPWGTSSVPERPAETLS